MKKKIAKLLAAAMCVSLLAACGGGEGAATPAPEASKAPVAEQTTGESITLSVGHGQSEAHSYHTALLKFKDLIEEKSGGQITANVQANGALGDEKEMSESLQLGTVDMCTAAVATLTGFDGDLDVFNLPYLFDSSEQALKVLESDIGKEAFAGLEEQGIKVLGFFDLGMRSMTNSLRPINTPEDCAGLRMRTLQSSVCVEGLSALGIDAVSMSFSELFTALQTGAVDGQENPISVINASQFYEVQKYLSLTEHIYPVLPVMISVSTWNKLSADQQALVTECIEEAIQYQHELNQADYESYIQNLKDNGMEINEVDKAPFKAAVQPVYDKYASQWGDLISQIQAVK